MEVAKVAEHKVIEKADSEEEKKKRKLLIIKIIPVAVLAFILIAVSVHVTIKQMTAETA